MLIVASIALALSYFMLIWLKSNAFVEYLTLFKLDYLFHVNEYNELEKNGYGGNYAEFLREYYYDNFFVRLFTCPICLSFWLGLTEALGLGTSYSVVGGPLILFFYLLLNKML